MIIVLILSDCYNIRTMTVQTASYHGIEALSAEIFDILLSELNGAHLRLSVFVVCHNFLHHLTTFVMLTFLLYMSLPGQQNKEI